MNAKRLIVNADEDVDVHEHAHRFFGERATVEALVSLVRALAPGTTELVCHPAIVDDGLRSTSGHAEPSARELEALTSDAARDAVREAGVLVGFSAL